LSVRKANKIESSDRVLTNIDRFPLYMNLSLVEMRLQSKALQDYSSYSQ